ncbi:MAG TPA: hypothetical protein VM889_06975 [Candidatus Thermoplasmatota archaeon]|nr:hypothetical protein [Candidatus Thermoplasmatota archaeon]
MRPPFIIVALLVTAPLGFVRAESPDAPDDWQHALPVPTQDIHGTVDWADVDWYRLSVPAGYVLVVRSDFSWDGVRPIISLLSSSGQTLSEVRSPDGCPWQGCPPLIVKAGAADGILIVGFRSKSLLLAEKPYHLKIQIQPGVDLRVSAPRIVPVNAYTARVEVDIANGGPALAAGSTVSLWSRPVHPPTAGPRNIWTFTVSPQAGSSQSLVVHWNQLLQAGDFVVWATATHPDEVDPRDNTNETRTWIAVGGLGMGFDAPQRKLAAAPLYVTTGHDARGVYLDVAVESYRVVIGRGCFLSC